MARTTPESAERKAINRDAVGRLPRGYLVTHLMEGLRSLILFDLDWGEILPGFGRRARRGDAGAQRADNPGLRLAHPRRSVGPGADAPDSLDRDSHAGAGRRIVHRREADLRAQVPRASRCKSSGAPPSSIVARPWPTTYSRRPGGWIPVPSNETATRGSRLTFSSLRSCGFRCAVTSSSPSTAARRSHCGLASGLMVTRWPSAPVRISSSALSGRVTEAELRSRARGPRAGTRPRSAGVQPVRERGPGRDRHPDLAHVATFVGDRPGQGPVRKSPTQYPAA